MTSADIGDLIIVIIIGFMITVIAWFYLRGEAHF